MPMIRLVDLAHARSGDKGDTANIGVVAYDPRDWELLSETLTPERVKAHFGALVEGPVERFELPRLQALNFLLHGALGGGGTVSLMTDAQGKVLSTALLRMELEVPAEVAERVRGRGRLPTERGGPPVADAPLKSDAPPKSHAPLRSDGTGTEDLLVEWREGGVLRLTLNRPDRRNALNTGLVRALLAGLRGAVEEEGLRVIVLTGAGPDFCAGADLEELRRTAAAGVEESLADAHRMAELFLALRHHPVPVVAAVRGRALGGGFGLAAACDLVLAEEGAEFGLPEVHLGFVPAMVMALLRRKLGEGRTLELAILGEMLEADAAARAGFVNRIYPRAAFADAVGEYASRLASRPSSAVRLTKRLFHGLDQASLEEGLARGAELNALARMTDDCRRGVEEFLARRRDR
jgi:methylglutaconyl-CoA hydratase